MRRIVHLSRLWATVGSLGLVLALASTPAEARSHRHKGHGRHHHAAHRHAAIGGYSPPFAAIMVDGNTGKMLYGRNEHELRHPASITKVMTLYMLFDQIEKGRLSLNSQITMSAHAASMAPSKLGLPPGHSLSVETAIKAVVTKSANDVAVAIAETIGGTEEHFAELMTARAHALGMTRTTYVNASGLPDSEQVTTAHDLSLLGRAIQDRFPSYYRYFSTPRFTYNGRQIANHNHLLGRVEGMDGIKTGYTRDSGFNLLTSVKRDGHKLIGVVLGGKSAGVRDRIMADLIEENIDNTSTKRTAPMLAETASEATSRAETAEVATKSIPIPVPAPVTAPVAAAAPAERARPAVIAATKDIETDRAASTGAPARRSVGDGSTGARSTALGSTASALPSTTPNATPMRWVAGPAAQGVAAQGVAAVPPAHPDGKLALRTETRIAKTEPKAEPVSAPPAAVHTGVQIQIGATDGADKAQDLLSRARDASKHRLASATPYTEKVQKGSETLWRARFAGLDASSAEAACKDLKRSGFSCFTTKN